MAKSALGRFVFCRPYPANVTLVFGVCFTSMMLDTPGRASTLARKECSHPQAPAPIRFAGISLLGLLLLAGCAGSGAGREQALRCSDGMCPLNKPRPTIGVIVVPRKASLTVETGVANQS